MREPSSTLKSLVDESIVKGGSTGKVEWVAGDISEKDVVEKACEGITHIYHVAALVGPYFPRALYFKVNYEGSLNILEGARVHKGE